MCKRILACLLLLLVVPVQGQAASDIYTSNKGQFRVSYESDLSPIAINQIHSWVLHLADAEGKPVSNAMLSIKGGMPEHNHGLATAPTIEAVGDGNYALQGIRFHMMGYWELELTIKDGSITDTVVIPLEL